MKNYFYCESKSGHFFVPINFGTANLKPGQFQKSGTYSIPDINVT